MDMAHNKINPSSTLHVCLWKFDLGSFWCVCVLHFRVGFSLCICRFLFLSVSWRRAGALGCDSAVHHMLSSWSTLNKMTGDEQMDFLSMWPSLHNEYVIVPRSSDFFYSYSWVVHSVAAVIRALQWDSLAVNGQNCYFRNECCGAF